VPGEYIENPRRSPRAPFRFDARVAVRGAVFFEGATIDYGPGGCQVPTPVPLPPGARVFVELKHATTRAPFYFSGRVAWTRTDPTPRAGIAFDDASASPAGSLYQEVTAADLGGDDLPRAPERIQVDAALAPVLPPPSAPVLTPEEMVVLGALGSGATAGALREKLGARWDRTVNALFALLGQGLVVVGPPDAGAAREWKRRLLLR
jgi:hypothetical protein